MPELTTPGRYQAPPSEARASGCLLPWWREEPAWRVSYDVCGITLLFLDPPYYVPPEVMEPYLRHVVGRFAGVCPDPWALVRGAHVTYSADMAEGVHGRHYPGTRQVVCRSSLIGHVDEHELSLVMCHSLRPGQPEGPEDDPDSDLAWMQRQGITMGAYRPA